MVKQFIGASRNRTTLIDSFKANKQIKFIDFSNDSDISRHKLLELLLYKKDIFKKSKEISIIKPLIDKLSVVVDERTLRDILHENC